jgi:hypothetical protein
MAAVRAAPATALVEVFRNSRRVVVFGHGVDSGVHRLKLPKGAYSYTDLNIQQPTSNTQHPLIAYTEALGSSMLDVGCWMLRLLTLTYFF